MSLQDQLRVYATDREPSPLSSLLYRVIQALENRDEVLAAIEWGPAPHHSMSTCPCCLEYKSDGHAKDCWYAPK